MEEYLLYKFDNDGEKRYIQTIYDDSVSTHSNVNEAIRFNDKDLVLKLRDYLNAREKCTFKVCKIETKMEEIEE